MTVRRQAASLACLVLLLRAGGDLCPAAESVVRAGLEGLAWQSPTTIHESERLLLAAIRLPLLEARDCAAALQWWFDGRIADAKGDKGAAAAAWAAGCRTLDRPGDPVQAVWPEPVEARLRPLHALTGLPLYLVSGYVVAWRGDAGQQVGLLLVPKPVPTGHRYPLLVYVHGGQKGLQLPEITWLAEQCRKGYVVLAPALRGQPLGDSSVPQLAERRCEGSPDDGAGESCDVASAMAGATSLTVARAEACVLLGLGSGALPALLAAARSPQVACVAVADAGRLDPFRHYYARMSRGENRWPEWAAFCSRTPAEQLAAMARQSVLHQADALHCPVLLLLPEECLGSLDEEIHRDLAQRLTAAGPTARVEVVPGARRGYTTDLTATATQQSLRQLARFAYASAPPNDGKDALLIPPRQDSGSTHGP